MENAVIDRPDLAERWPTAEAVRTATFDYGRRVGLAVQFKHSGLRFAVRSCEAGSLESLIPEMDAYIAEAPYGRNRFGKPWEPRANG
jgi:hypothetical protein